MEILKEFVKEYIKIISSSLRIPLLHFYPHKIIIISYLWGSMGNTQEIISKNNSGENRLFQVGTVHIMKGCK